MVKIYLIWFFLQNPGFLDSSIIFNLSSLLRRFLWIFGVIGVQGAIGKLYSLWLNDCKVKFDQKKCHSTPEHCFIACW